VNVGLIIRDLRDAKGISREEMANITGLSYWTIEKLETGRTNPRVDTVCKLLKFLEANLFVLPIDPLPDAEPYRVTAKK
jgi:transcriptional regulator with XRE-family HTH domain